MSNDSPKAPMTSKDRLLAAATLAPLDRPPVVPIGNFPMFRAAGMQIGRMDERVEKAAASVIEARQICGHDCLYGRIGQNYEIQAMGGELHIEDDGYPAVIDPRLVKDAGDLKKLDPAKLRTNGPLKAEAAVTRILADAAGDEVPVMAYCQGVMRLAGQLMGPEVLMLAVMDTPDMVGEVLDFAVEVSLIKAEMALASGANLFFVSDPMASGDLISPQTYEQLVLPRASRLINGIKAAGDVTVIYHICGDSSRILPMMAATGADILSMDWKVGLAEAKAAVGDRVCLMGNLDPVHVVMEATAETVQAEARKCLAVFENGQGFVLSGGCALPAATPLENIRAMVLAAEQSAQGA